MGRSGASPLEYPAMAHIAKRLVLEGVWGEETLELRLFARTSLALIYPTCRVVV